MRSLIALSPFSGIIARLITMGQFLSPWKMQIQKHIGSISINAQSQAAKE